MTSSNNELFIGQARVKCECGNIVVFLRKYPCTCRQCGRLVYPTKQIEFIKKLKKEIKKHEQSIINR